MALIEAIFHALIKLASLFFPISQSGLGRTRGRFHVFDRQKLRAKWARPDFNDSEQGKQEREKKIEFANSGPFGF